MHTCLNPVTTGGSPSLRSFLETAAKYGYEGIEYGIEPVAELVKEGTIEIVKETFTSRGIGLVCFGLPVEFRRDEASFKSDLEKLPSLAKIAREIDCRCCCTWLPPSVDEPPAEYTCRVIRRLRECVKILRDYEIELALEWVGPATSRTRKHDFIHTLEGALELGEAMGGSGVGLLFDSFHWFTTRGSIQQIEALPLEKIIHVHINDAPDVPIDKQIDNQRLLPGEGVIDLVGMLRALRDKGYKGYISVETFSQELAKLGMDEAARRAKKALDSIIDRL